jgi:hypothetical protein
MNFTLFLNSRGRLNQLKKFIDICEKVTQDHSQVEMIITGDDDDPPTARFLSQLPGRNTFTFRTIIGPRPTSLCASFNNMARMAEGKYLLVLNDDAEIVTPHWDTIALSRIIYYKAFNRYKDDIIYGCTTDLSADKIAGKKYAAFPIISKQAVDALGFFMYEQFVGLGGDSSIYRVYEAVNRVVDMSDIILDHVYHNSLLRVMTPDKTAHEMRMNTQANPVDPFSFDITVDVARLTRFIREQNQ